MMNRSRSALIIALAAMAALGAGGGSSAFAASWFVNGTKLTPKATVAIANVATVDVSTVLEEPSLGVKLTCSGKELGIMGGYIQAEAFGGAESIKFKGCSEIAPTTCTIQTEIVTEPVVFSTETGSNALDRLRASPKSGKFFATINFRGSCAESGEQPVNGQLVLDAIDGQTELVTQRIEGLGATENNSLELFKAKAYLTGEALLKLASGLPWSFH